MAYLGDRMGVGSSRIDSPILTVERYGYRPPGMSSRMGVGMGIAGVDDAILASVAAETTAELAAGGGVGGGAAAAGSGIGLNAATLSQAFNILGALDSQLGIVDSFLGGLKAEAAQPAIGKKISETMNAITRDLLGYPGDSQDERRVFFRLGEILAKADPKVAAKGWAYAGYGNNTVDKKGQEGTDFRTRTGRKGKILGLEGHLQPETVLGVRVEVGKMGELLSIMKSVLETVTRFKVAFAAIPTQAERRAVFAGCCDKWLAGTKWKDGMGFLPTAKPPSDTFMAVILAPRGSGKKSGDSGSGNTAGDSGSGGLIAGIAALAGLYLLTKG